MTKKLFLTSILTMCTIAPAMAVPAQPGATVDSNTMCTIEGIGVDDGTALMEAIWTPITYACTAGQYLYIGLDANNNEVAECRTCLANSYCGGAPDGTPYTVENHSGDIISCSTVGDGSYTSSAAGSWENTQCYRSCNISNMGTTFANIPHATAVSGNDYYGNGSDTCGATECASGWHVKQGINLATELSNVDGVSSAYINNSGGYIENYGNQTKGQAYYGITANNAWAVDFGNKGIISGSARCSSVSAATLITAEMGAVGGNNCYCNITGYKAVGENLQSILSSSWVMNAHTVGIGDCVARCPYMCAAIVRYGSNDTYSSFRSTLFGSVGTLPASCEANVIDINWYNQDSIHEQNQCTYNEGITLPTQPEDRTGYTFGGWRIKANTNNNNNNSNSGSGNE